ncbi:MAG: elongation factor P [Elusimicrobia bacterium RIFCSPHIGHO2_01_FULL_64_10]|nr:MAG: elongation factor P [Elusimicrobia bacterium RIFCSPHIGHO2_01_FULL_64_10]
MIDTSDFKNGILFEDDGVVYQVLWFQHHKPGKGGAVMRTKIRNMRNGAITERTYKSGVRFKEIALTRKKKQFLYSDGDAYTFMDQATFDQITVPAEKIKPLTPYIKEDMEVEALYIDDEFLGLDLPASVELKVTQTVPGLKGDTVSNVMKPATVETGAEVQVPLFIKEGDVVRVDTRTGEYVSRV